MSKPMPKPAAKSPAPKAAAKPAPAPRRDAAKKEPPKPVKAAPKAKAAAAPKAKAAAAPKAAPPPKAPQPAKAASKPPQPAPPPKALKAPPAAKAPPAKPAKTAAKVEPPKAQPGKGPAKKADVKPAAPAKPVAPAKGKAEAAPKPKAAPVTEAKPLKGNKASPEPKTEAKPAPKAKVAAAKPEPAPKPVKEKPVKAPKPPKLAPVAAAFAKPMPAKPLAVAAGRAQPITRMATPLPVRTAPKPLTAPKPVNEPELVGDSMPVPAFKGKVAGAKGMVLVGAIGGAFGVKGEVRLRAFTEKKDGVIAYGPLYGDDGKILLRPKSWRELKDGVAVVAAEVKSKEQADKMRGQRLFVPRANLPPTAEDEFYVVDLLGCRAESLDGQVLGEICAVWNFGAGDVIEYRPPNGPNVRLTFSKQAVPHVDLAAKRVVLDPPPPEPEGK